LTNTFLPAWGDSTLIGGVVPGSFTALTNGMEFRQAFGSTSVVARLTSPHLGVTNVVHYEVMDWGGATPIQTGVRALSDSSEHFYGFGEKFFDFDHAGKKT